MKAYFVSDLHLKNMEEQRSQKFLKFLESLEQDAHLTHLFLVGDIFDLWISDHHFFVKRFEPLIASLRRLQGRGVQIHYFEGNHDLYLKKFWGGQLGANVHENWGVFDLGVLKVRVEHGDLIDPDDRGYRFLRWFLRTSVMTFLAHRLPSRLVAWIGSRASHASRQYTSDVKTITRTGAINKIHAYARKLIGENLDLLVSGHLHVRDDIVLQEGGGRIRSVNLGSWYDTPCAFLLADDRQEFVEL